MRSAVWSTRITAALIVIYLVPLHTRSAELTSTAGTVGVGVPTTADDAQWMNKGVWTARLHDHQVLLGTIRRLGPKGTFYQPMMHPKGASVVFREADRHGERYSKLRR